MSPRSAIEYGLKCNGADEGEGSSSSELSAGELDLAAAPQKLQDGLFINNLWYLNYSDRNKCRITGMTRFCSYLVEAGEPVAPLNVLRFDDSFYELFGAKLEDLTRERSLLMDAGTYYQRSCGDSLLPGALIRGMRFTL